MFIAKAFPLRIPEEHPIWFAHGQFPHRIGHTTVNEIMALPLRGPVSRPWKPPQQELEAAVAEGEAVLQLPGGSKKCMQQ